MPNPAKILIVDDELHIRKYLSLLVRTSLGVSTVIEAADGATALTLYASEKPDMVLLDINLIGGSGLEVLGQLLQLDPDAVVVMNTAVNIRRSVEEAVEKGASGYILKDTPQEEIVAALREIINDVFGDAPSSASTA
ncbi:MAG: response regulator transcription factor [Cephaloticoccus sp.]|nr:response regulator transcription factor [Cephaloticoccus sp.]MCF7759488.1 response regulator transcription factor [Cephaloticoccus sp.]